MKPKTMLMIGMLFLNSAVLAADVVNVKGIGMDLARDIANEAVEVCRKQGYHVTAVVVDRHGLLRVALRDDLAARFTLQIAEQKANAAVMSGIDSGAFRANRADIRPEMNHVEGILMMQGGVLINAGGYRIGAVGVSGAPGGEKDEVCAKQALKKYQERLEFAE
ncbi:MAG: heme-binding protein [Gammaproteobacteria bacterium]|nr:heme-binding protein [Gammaproteobacteria bacterium]